MRKLGWRSSLLALLAISGGLFALQAQAGVIIEDVQWVNAHALAPGSAGWTWEDQAATLEVWEGYDAEVSIPVGCEVSALADQDPVIHIVKAVTNNSTFEWTDYHIEITGSPGVAYVPGSATSDRFQIIQENGDIVDFYAPQSVPIGDTVTLELDILLPAGIVTFDIYQVPTPEPATLLLLGLGGAAAVVWNRRRRA